MEDERIAHSEVGSCCWHSTDWGAKHDRNDNDYFGELYRYELPAKSYEPTSRDRKAVQAYFDEQRPSDRPLKVVKRG